VQFVDWDKSERGPQRRKTASGRLLHCCCICESLAPWGDSWSTYCSVKELDDGAPIPKFCSAACRRKGGRNAENVTDAMKAKAKEAEWREPTVVYREATDREKYWDAARAQRSRDWRKSQEPGGEPWHGARA